MSAGMGDYDDGFADTQEALQGTSMEGEAEWTSLAEMVPGCCVFNNVDPSDLHQGSIGDCWLISAMACLAEYPDVIQGLIREEDDHYVVNLYSYSAGQFIPVEINDKVPSWVGNNGKEPWCVKPTQDGEIWPCLIEKAFAKIGGGFINLKGGWSHFAFGMMKGTTNLFQCSSQAAGEPYLCWIPIFSEDNLKEGVEWGGGDEKESDAMWQELVSCNKSQFLMAASSNNGSDTDQSAQGVVQGHAYTILDVVDGPGGSDFRLIQVRNPWGHSEWTGPWSDGSPEWDNNPEVRDALDPEEKEDGAFWMPWWDFQEQYRSIFLCKGSAGKRTVIAGAPPNACADCPLQ